MFLVLTIPFFLIHFFSKKHKFNKKTAPVLFFIYYISVTLLIQLALHTDVGLLSTIRYVLFLVFLLLAFRYFDFKLGIKTLKITTLLISVYVIIQFLYFFILNRTLPWYIPFLKVMDNSFILKEQSEYYLTFYRPTGIFLEPTHFAQYCVVYLVYLLFSNIKEKIKVVEVLIITAAIIASGSSLGLIFIVFVFTLWFIVKQWNGISPIKLMVTLISVVIAIFMIFKLDYFQNTINRMITENGFNGAAVGYRFDSLSLFIQEDFSLLQWFIGSGRGSEEAYLTGIFYLLYTNGFLGLLLYFLICFSAMKNSDMFGKVMVISTLILSIGSEFVGNFGILFYFSFIYGIRYVENTQLSSLQHENNLSLRIKKQGEIL